MSNTGCTFAWVTTDGTARRSNVARLLRSWGTATPLTAMEVLRIDSSESIRYCGVWTTNGYGMPVRGSDQKLGETKRFPLRVTRGLFAMSRCVSPSSAARVRSTSTWSAGACTIWCRWTSAKPRIRASRAWEVLGYGIRGVLVDASDPHVDRCWQAEVEDLIDNVSRLEEERDARKLSRQVLP